MAEWVRRGEKGQWGSRVEMGGRRIQGFGEVAGEGGGEGGDWRGWRSMNENCRSRSTFAGEGGDCRKRRAIEDWLQQRRRVNYRINGDQEEGG